MTGPGHGADPYADPARSLAYACFRANIDWAKAARECGDPKCDGDCRYITAIRRLVREIDGGILPAPDEED